MGMGEMEEQGGGGLDKKVKMRWSEETQAFGVSWVHHQSFQVPLRDCW